MTAFEERHGFMIQPNPEYRPKPGQKSPTPDDDERKRFRIALAVVSIAILAVIGVSVAIVNMASDDGPDESSALVMGPAYTEDELAYLSAVRPQLKYDVDSALLVGLGRMTADYLDQGYSMEDAIISLHNAAVREGRAHIIDWRACMVIVRAAYYHLSSSGP
ncbi:hypothetical protein [Gordonia alkanivorans]|uniref:hypothetical protein n=1 Tax=Gordonia alkanivorans TaxID=84096 RepID=UPI0004B19D45|nr:hypothetical protein [Gordonia alkanivorans]